MEFSTTVAAVQPESTGNSEMLAMQREQDRGRRFAELLQTEPLRENLYVDPPAAGVSGGNPVVSVVSRFDELDFAAKALERAETFSYQEGAAGGPGTELTRVGREAVFVQAEMLRTVMLMETVNTCKQGITTIFQQQG